MAELPQIRASALAYQRQNGLRMPEGNYAQSVITEKASHAVGRAYDRLPEFDRSALPAFHAMREETARQFEHMTSPTSKGGLGIHVEVTPHDPYTGGVDQVYRQFRGDVEQHNRMKVFSTASTGGHPVLSNDENDMFRAVHDVYGHLGSGRGIDHDGEEAAYQKHSRMFSPLARQALATETRGQNSALRLHGGFQDQKVGLLPAHMQTSQFARIGGTTELINAHKRAARRSAEQGL